MKDKVKTIAIISFLIFFVFGGYVFFMEQCCGPKKVSAAVMLQSAERYQELYKSNPNQ